MIGWLLFASVVGVAALPVIRRVYVFAGEIIRPDGSREVWDGRIPPGAIVPLGGMAVAISALSVGYMSGAFSVISVGGGPSARGAGAVMVPDTPGLTVVMFAPSGDSARLVSSAFSGQGSLDSVRFRADTSGATPTGAKFSSQTGTTLTDTATALDSGAVLSFQVQHCSAAGCSAWSEAVGVSMVYPAPATPTVDAVAFAATGDSLRAVGTAFSSSGDSDAHDSTDIEVDSAGKGFSSPQYHNVTLGAVLTDTAASIDSGAVVDVRMRYKGRGGWSVWGTLSGVTMAFGSVPSTPSVALAPVSRTGDSVRIVSSTYGDAGSLDSVEFEVDTAGGDFSSPQYHDVVLGAVLTDTVVSVDSAARIKARTRHKNSVGWSAWSDTARVWSAFHEPAGMSVIYSNPGTSMDFATEGWTVVEKQTCPDDCFLGRMSILSGRANPAGGDSVIELDHPVTGDYDTDTGGSLNVANYSDLAGFAGGNQSQIYVRFRFRSTLGFPWGKPFYLGISPEADGDAADVASDYYVTIEGPNTGGMLSENQGIGRTPKAGGSLCWPGTSQEPFPHTGDDWQTAWHVVEVITTAESSVGAQDGTVAIYIDGIAVQHCQPENTLDSLYWSESGASESSFDGFIWQFATNQSGSPQTEISESTIEWGELYISGKD